MAVARDGVANLVQWTDENTTRVAVAETAGTGEPVLQGKPDVTVFFDYPGTRLHYVQWAAPPLAHLPNQYYNWGVFVPRGYETSKIRRLSIFFHDRHERFLKPAWPHRLDTVLLSPHDAPYRSYGYGYHESLGTLRSFKEGKVEPFFGRRVDAFLAWAIKTYDAEPGRVSCGGHGEWGGTAALQYGIKRPGNNKAGTLSTGLATLRRDGFASMDADESGGTLTTRPVLFGGRHLFVNVDDPQGELRVEVLNPAGQVVMPFTLENCLPLTANRTLQVVSWRGVADLSSITHQPVRFRFHLRNGRLYAFWVSPDVSGSSQGYVAAGGPGFSSNRDLGQ